MSKSSSRSSEADKYNSIISRYFAPTILHKLSDDEKINLGSSLDSIDKINFLNPQKIDAMNKSVSTVIEMALQKGINIHELSTLVDKLAPLYDTVFMMIFNDESDPQYKNFIDSLESRISTAKENVNSPFHQKLASYLDYLNKKIKSDENICSMDYMLLYSLMLAQYIDEINHDSTYTETNELFNLMQINNILPGIGGVSESIYSCSTGQRNNLFLMHTRLIIEKAIKIYFELLQGKQ
jgi:hypothetical protein